ncbi:MAG: hypothetical protein ACK41E_09455 [Deinococcales bacterium]
MFDPDSFHQAYLRLCRQSFWAGFAPLEIPVLVWDGTRTYCFLHPNPPAPFEPEWDWFVAEGRVEMVVGNTTGTLEIMPVAMVLADNMDTKSTTFVALHEAFHAHQQMFYPRWGANELDFLSYPMLDADTLALRRLETRLLAKALETWDLGWVKAAFKARTSRFKRLEKKHQDLEREWERYEGSALFVEARARGQRLELPLEDFPADALRQRAYLTGRAWLELLVRFAPQSLPQLQNEYIDVLLKQSAKSAQERPITFGVLELERGRAQLEIEALKLERDRLRREFFESSSFLVEIRSQTALNPQGFDPMNLKVLENGELLHQRFLRLGDKRGSFEVLGVPTLTFGEPHPMQIKTTYIKLPSAPGASRMGKVVLQHQNLKLEFESARLELLDKAMRVTIA